MGKGYDNGRDKGQTERQEEDKTMTYNTMVIMGALVSLAGVYFVVRKKEMRLSGAGILAAGLICLFWGIFAR